MPEIDYESLHCNEKDQNPEIIAAGEPWTPFPRRVQQNKKKTSKTDYI